MSNDEACRHLATLAAPGCDGMDLDWLLRRRAEPADTRADGMTAHIGDSAITDMQQRAESLYAVVEWELRSFRRPASV